jgi:2-keto-4-pentenoate hydratase
VLCLELCGKRHSIAEPPSNLIGLADCSSAGGVVCGARFPAASLDPSTLSTVPTQILINGESVASGTGGASPFGSPLASLTWCANHLSMRGRKLAAGELVIGGSTCKSQAFRSGDTVAVTFGELGRLETTIMP